MANTTAATHNVAEALLSALQTSIVKEMCSKWGFESELEDLKSTVSDARKVLLDAEAKQELVDETRECILKLSDAVYDADDLFDELLTVAHLRKGNLRGDKLSAKVRDFFSVNTMRHCVESIMHQFESMTSSRRKFSFQIDYQPIREARDDILSYFNERNTVIGRKDDMNAVIDLLLHSDVNDDVSFLSIVGGRGSGKTTLAKLVYHNERVTAEFAMRMWVDVLDGNEKYLKANAILAKILGCLDSSGGLYTELDSMLQLKISQKLGGKKFLLVLDNVCIADLQEWLVLKNLLVFGGRGSRIIITTDNSEETTRVIGIKHTYELKGLSKEKTQCLFELAAFGKGQEHVSNDLELVAIGEKIVEKCCGDPLAVEHIGRLLFGQDISKWRLFENHALATIVDKREENLSFLLKLSYNNLESALKSCLSYCAMFPKGFIISKSKLLGLWMAQQYVVPHDGQSMEDVVEDYFTILLRRCLLQPVEGNEYGEIVSCKMHSIVHDTTLEVAGQETCVVDSITDNMDVDLRHLHQVRRNSSTSSFSKMKIRSYVHDILDVSFPPLDELVSCWMRLRALDLHHLNIKRLPDSIGKLLHLRYLDLSNNPLKRLPNSITKLYNLQTLNLDGCTEFAELPRDISKLVNLRSLNINECYGILYMPSGLEKLTCLHSLTAFIVAGKIFIDEESSSEDEGSIAPTRSISMLKDLKTLTNLRGSIRISIHEKIKNLDDCQSIDGSTGGYLGGMEHLREVSIEFDRDDVYDEVASSHHEAFLVKMQPHRNLKGILMWGYQGKTLSMWAISLPNLVKIDIRSSGRLQRLSLVSKLQHLQYLTLTDLSNLEYMEETARSTSGCQSFFPSLKYLVIRSMPKFKAWWEDQNDESCWQPSFLRLSKLSVTDCCMLVSFPPCPRVEKLHLGGLGENFRIMDGSHSDESKPLALKEVTNYRDIGHLKSLPTGTPRNITISWGNNVERLSQVEEAFKKCSSSLRNLTITGCENLTSVSGALEYLTALETLSIIECRMLTFPEEDTMIWSSLQHSLRSLELRHVDRMEILPKGMQYLTTLQDLTIECCRKLKGLPEWISSLSSIKAIRVTYCDQFQSLPETMRNLTSLKLLDLSNCNEGMKKKCQNPDGEDWAKIQHVPCIVISPY